MMFLYFVGGEKCIRNDAQVVIVNSTMFTN